MYHFVFIYMLYQWVSLNELELMDSNSGSLFVSMKVFPHAMFTSVVFLMAYISRSPNIFRHSGGFKEMARHPRWPQRQINLNHNSRLA